MLKIEHMRMQLPQGFEHRAATIARLVGEAMGAIQFPENRTLDRLTIGPVGVSPQTTDQEIAKRIADRILATLGSVP